MLHNLSLDITRKGFQFLSTVKQRDIALGRIRPSVCVCCQYKGRGLPRATKANYLQVWNKKKVH